MKEQKLIDLIEQWLDQSISEQDLTLLKAELLANRSALEHYVNMAEMQSMLEQASAQTQQLSNIVPMERIVRRQKRRTFRVALVAAAAVVVLSLITMKMFYIDVAQSPALAFETSPGTQFTLTHSSSDEALTGMVMEKGSRLQLRQGTVELEFASGVKSIIIAPADLTMHGDDQLYLNEGIAWFHVPEQAIGFRVKTKDLDIVDLGTEFGVLAIRDNHDELHVIKGKVKVTTTRVRKESATLIAGEARRIDPIGRLDTIPSTPNVFLTSLPKSLPYLHWSFNEVESGGFPADGLNAALQLGFAIPRNAQASSMQIPGRFGKAIRFTGKPGEEILTEWPSVSGSKPRTIACWIRVAAQSLNSGGSSIAVWGKDKYGYAGWPTKWKLAISPDGKPIVVGYDGGVAGRPNVADNQWHHIACSHEMNAQGKPIVKMFVDGQQVENIWRPRKGANTEAPSTIVAPNTVISGVSYFPLQFGKSLDGTLPIRADLDEIYIFEGALDAQTIQRLATDNQHQP